MSDTATDPNDPNPPPTTSPTNPPDSSYTGDGGQHPSDQPYTPYYAPSATDAGDAGQDTGTGTGGGSGGSGPAPVVTDPPGSNPSAGGANGNAQIRNLTYAIGVPGAHPRLLLTVSDPDQAYQQEQNGEVCFTVDALPAEPYAITTDGTALETVAQALADVQLAARLAAQAVLAMQLYGYVSIYGALSADDASRSRLSNAYLGAKTYADEQGITDPSYDTGIRWRLNDNSFSPDLPLNVLAGLVVGTSNWAKSCQDNYWSIVDRIAAATTNDAVNAIDVTAGYPSPPGSPQHP